MASHFAPWQQWVAAVRAGDRRTAERGLAAFRLTAWLARHMEANRAAFRWEHLCGAHFRWVDERCSLVCE